MARLVSIGTQDFAKLREREAFYVDKSRLIREWWESSDEITIITRPRRFGKTLNLSMLECFFSKRYAGRGEELFGGMSIWDDEQYRAIQGTMPVVSVSFASCKGGNIDVLISYMKRALRTACDNHAYLLSSSRVEENTGSFLTSVNDQMSDSTATSCLNQLCRALEAHYGVKPIVLLDEYDTPMQEAWLAGCWDQMVDFIRPLFNATFKTNPSLGRAFITGITRVSRESVFSDLNNLTVVSTTTPRYETCFGFTEDEVFAAMDEMGLSDKEGVKRWYDGFSFGRSTDIYNPWSITNYLDDPRLLPWWANTSGNGLVSDLLRRDDGSLKPDFEILLDGGYVVKSIDEQVVFNDLAMDESAVWSLLLASGYLRADNASLDDDGRTVCELRITNWETRAAFAVMVRRWFGGTSDDNRYNRFIRALLAGNLEDANDYLADVLLACISSFDGGAHSNPRTLPERFYHGLVLGMLVDLRGRYEVSSNRESGYGRYDVMLVPLRHDDPAFVLEFKLFDPRREQTLEDTARRAHEQMQARAYATALVERGIAPGRIREVAFAFRGKEVLLA